MIDTAQIILLVVVVILTVLLVALGVQVFFILRELRRTVSKANKVLEDTGTITESVSKPLSSLSNLTSGLRVGTLIAGLLKGKGKKIRQLLKDDDE